MRGRILYMIYGEKAERPQRPRSGRSRPKSPARAGLGWKIKSHDKTHFIAVYVFEYHFLTSICFRLLLSMGLKAIGAEPARVARLLRPLRVPWAVSSK